MKKGGAGTKVVMRISSITAQQGSIMNHYVPGSGVGATSVFARRAKLYRATPNTTPVIPLKVPDAPTSVNVVSGDSAVLVSFTSPINNGGASITSYTVVSSPGGITASGASSPINVTGLTNGTAYTFTVYATNSVGNSVSSSSSSSVTPISSASPLAPVLVSVSSKTTTSIVITFTQEPNGSPAILNYKYSLNGGSFTAFSPVDTSSPVTISGLTSNTTYTITLKATNVNGDSDESNSITETTYANVNYSRFTTVGASTWTAPSNVTEIEYLVVGGGGGGGSTYSSIEVINSVTFQSSNPGPGVYWINSAAGTFYGYLYKGSSRYTSSSPVRLTAPQNITPNGAVYPYNKWYDFEMVYWSISSGFPTASNVTYVLPQGEPSNYYSNNVSAGSGGGGGGYIKTSSVYPFTKYSVAPGTTYNLYVGSGGAGGVGSTGTETYGASGEASYFDTITAPGGLGGNASRVGFSQNGGGGYYGENIMGGRGGAGGARNSGSVVNSEVYQWNSTVLRGTTGGSGVSINFDGSGNVVYSGGGDGGDSNTVATSTTPQNVGKGGEGTGATLNSYASGIDGGSGIVVLKYYT
jgi:hypothetical protein